MFHLSSVPSFDSLKDTIDVEDVKEELVLTIPNETIRRLYYNYIREGYRKNQANQIGIDIFRS